MALPKHEIRRGAARIELLLVFAVIALVFQLWPSLWDLFAFAIDVRNWPRSVWYLGNVAVVAILIAIRVGPDLLEDWRERRQRVAKESVEKEMAAQLKEQREAVERMEQSRDRRIY